MPVLCAPALAVNPQAPPLRMAGSQLQSFVHRASGGPLGWLGKSVSVYADQDPFWNELAQVRQSQTNEELEKYFLANTHRLPLALRAKVSDSLRLALFLTGVRAQIEQAAQV